MGPALAQVLTLAAEVRQHAQSTGLIVFSYLNPILRMGMEKFCKVARARGVDGALVTDLPVEEAGEYLRAMREHDLAPVFLAAPTSPDERLKRIAEASRGFVYAVSRTGVTGARQQLADDAQKVGAAVAARDQVADGVGIWDFYGGTVCGSGRVCRCGGSGQRDCGERLSGIGGERPRLWENLSEKLTGRVRVRTSPALSKERAMTADPARIGMRLRLRSGQAFDCGCAWLSPSTILAQDRRVGIRTSWISTDWRKKIDELDRRLVELLSERAQAAVEIGRLKRDTSLPIYEPERERIVFENVQRMNRGPLPGRDLVRIYERIMDVMRNIQKEEIGAKADGAKAGQTELDSKVND